MSNSDLPAGYTIEPQAQDLPPGYTLEAVPHKFGLGDTWPAQLAKTLWSSFTLPGDVMAGKAQLPSSQGVPGSLPADQGNDTMGRVANAALLASPASAPLRAGEGALGAQIVIHPLPVNMRPTAAQTAVDLGAPLPRGLASSSPALRHRGRFRSLGPKLIRRQPIPSMQPVRPSIVWLLILPVA